MSRSRAGLFALVLLLWAVGDAQAQSTSSVQRKNCKDVLPTAARNIRCGGVCAPAPNVGPPASCARQWRDHACVQGGSLIASMSACVPGSASSTARAPAAACPIPCARKGQLAVSALPMHACSSEVIPLTSSLRIRWLPPANGACIDRYLVVVRPKVPVAGSDAREPETYQVGSSTNEFRRGTCNHGVVTAIDFGMLVSWGDSI